MQSAEAAVKGNYSFGNTSIDNHSHGNVSANKFDDSHNIKTGLLQHVTGSGVEITRYADGNTKMSIPTHQLGGLGEAELQQRTGTAFNDLKSTAQSETERWGTSTVEHTSAALSKLLGYDKSATLNTHAGKDWKDSLGGSEREAYENVESAADVLSEKWGLDKSSALKIAVAASAGLGVPKGLKFISGGVNANLGWTGQRAKHNVYNDAVNIARDKKLSESIDTLNNFAKSQNFGTQKSLNQNVADSIKEDFSKGYTASLNHGKSVENLRSIQEQESSFKELAQNTRVSLNFPLGEWGKNKFGEEKFATMLKSSPAKAQELVTNFVQEEIIGKGVFTPQSSSYVPKSNQAIEYQFRRAHRISENKGHQFAVQTINEEAKKKDSKLKDLKEQMESRVGLKNMIRNQIDIQGKERVKNFETKMKKNETKISEAQNKQQARFNQLQDDINNKKGIKKSTKKENV